MIKLVLTFLPLKPRSEMCQVRKRPLLQENLKTFRTTQLLKLHLLFKTNYVKNINEKGETKLRQVMTGINQRGNQEPEGNPGAAAKHQSREGRGNLNVWGGRQRVEGILVRLEFGKCNIY